MAYSRINWENEPSILTPINETNLNHMDAGIYNLDQNKMDASNPVGTGSLSMNRFPGSTVGTDSSTLGGMNAATGYYSHAEGFMNKALNSTAHAEGSDTKASGIDSHSQNSHTIAAGYSQTAMGRYNIEDHGDIYALIIGNGTDDDNRANMFTQDWDGNVKISGEIEDGNGIKLSDILPTDTESGNPCVITDAFGGSCETLSLDIEPIQSGSGTPSPQNVRPISGISSATITRTGKNMLPLIDTSGASNVTITSITNSDGVIIGYNLNGTATAEITKYITNNNIALPSASYYLSTGLTSEITGFQMVVAPSYTGVKTTNTLTGTIRNIYLNIKNGTVLNNVKIYPFVCLNSVTDKTFEPYTLQTITRTYGQTVYGGSDDVTGSGATSSFESITFDGTEPEWAASTTGTNFHQFVIERGYAKNSVNAVCNEFPKIDLSERGTVSGLVSYASDKTFRFSLNDNEYNITTLDQWKTWLGSHNLQLVYELGTPTTISLASQNIDLLHRDNVIVSNAKTVNVSYKADVQLYIDKKLSE